MYLNDSIACCGINEIADICDHDTPVGVLKEVFCQLHEKNMVWVPAGTDGYSYGRFVYKEGNLRHPSHLLFSDISRTKYKYGRALAAYIRRHGLGTVVMSRRQKNPNSGNTVQCWIWTPYWSKVEKHRKKLKEK